MNPYLAPGKLNRYGKFRLASDWLIAFHTIAIRYHLSADLDTHCWIGPRNHKPRRIEYELKNSDEKRSQSQSGRTSSNVTTRTKEMRRGAHLMLQCYIDRNINKVGTPARSSQILPFVGCIGTIPDVEASSLLSPLPTRGVSKFWIYCSNWSEFAR